MEISSKIIQVDHEKRDYGNESNLTLTFSRRNSETGFPPPRVLLTISQGESAQDVIKSLERTARVIHAQCIEDLE